MEGGNVADFLAFRRMLTPILIQALFWISLVFIIIAGLVALAIGETAEIRVAGVLILLLGPIAVRIYAELLMLAFRINETLTEIKNNTEPRLQ
jgi:hypothetical protein